MVWYLAFEPAWWTARWLSFRARYDSALDIISSGFPKTEPAGTRRRLLTLLCRKRFTQGVGSAAQVAVPIFVRQNTDTRVSGRSTPKRETEEQGANRTAAGPPGPEAKTEEAEDRRSRRFTAATRRVHTCVHRHPEEAELGPSQGRSNSPVVRSGDHRIHSW